MQKNTKKHFQSLVLEIETYRSHCLYPEAKKKCRELANLIRSNDQLKNRNTLIASLKKKYRRIEESAREFEAVGAKAMMTADEQEQVKRLFTASMDEGTDSAIYEGAVALLVFGQFQGAIPEFRKVIGKESFRVAAAKNIVRSYIGLSKIGHAVKQYEKWLSDKDFPPQDLEKIRVLLQVVLKKRGIKRKLPIPEVPLEIEVEVPQEEKSIDVVSIVLGFTDNSRKWHEVVLDVNFQRGNMISIIAGKNMPELIDYLKTGLRIDNVQFNSTEVIFFDSCVVYAKSPIKVGINQGGYTLTLQILNT